MRPGNDLDALVAAEIMGWKRERPRQSDYDAEDWKWLKDCEWFFEGDWYRHCPSFSEDIGDAWQLVEKYRLTVGWNGKRWEARDSWEGPVAWGEGETAPHAICLCVLMLEGVPPRL